MANRTVAVVLSANVANYITGMNAASRATAAAATDAQRLASQGQAFGDLGRMAMTGGALVVAGLALAVAKFAEFEKAISEVKAATQETAENMALLRDAALDAGARTAYSATEAANAIEELGKAGLTTQQILNGGLDGALTLAAAGGIEVAEAAGYAAIALKQFGLEGAQLPHVADLLAAGAGKAVGDVQDLAQALGQAGLVANGAGFSIEETTGVLAAFADAGLLGSDAGTSLKAAIIALQSPVPKSKELMEQYGLSVYDANGNMLGFSEIAGQLQEKLGGLTDEQRNATLAQIFGTDALRSANVLYKEGADGIQGYIDQTNDSGYAAQVAADRMDNLAGDIEKLGGAFDTALIKTGSGANDSLRSIVQTLTMLVDIVGEAPEPVLTTGLAIGTVAAATALTGGAALIAVPKFAAFRATIAASQITMGQFALRTAAMGGALGIAVVALGYFASQAADAKALTAEFTGTLDESTGAVTKYTREMVAKKLAEAGAFDTAQKVGISQRELTDAVLEGGDKAAAAQKKIGELNSVFNLFGEDNAFVAGNVQNSMRNISEAVDKSGEAFDDQAAAAEGSADSSGTAAEKYQEAATSAEELTSNLTDLIDTVNKANEVGQDAISTNATYQAGIADLADYVEQARQGVEGFSLGMDESTAAGSSNASMLADLAAKSQAAAEAQLVLDGNTDAFLATTAAGRQTIYDSAIALGATAEQAQVLTDKVYAIPDTKTIEVLAETAEATTKLTQFLRELNNIPGRRDVVINQVVTETGAARGAVGAAYRATGGAIVGPGTGTSDTAGLFNLSNGEHVLTAADVSKMGGQAGVYAFRESLYNSRGYASGGAVQYAQSAPVTNVTVAGAQLPPIYVQNPFTGEYLLAKVGGQIAAADRANSNTDRNGWAS